MDTNISKNKIGAFVCIAILLLIMAIILLNQDSFFSDDTEFVLFFHSSVSGLSVGAPVVFRGVPLGHVTNISLFASSKNNNITIPVTIKINKANILHKGSATTTTDDDETAEKILQRMIERGLRARIETNSFLTGQSRIELDFSPGTVAKYMGEKGMLEIPTIDSTKDKLMRTLGEIPINEIAENLLTSLKGVSNLVNNPKLTKSLDIFNNTMEEGNELFIRLNTLSKEMEKLVIKSNHSISIIDKDLPHMVLNFNNAMLSFSNTFKQLKETLINAENVVSHDSITIRSFNNAINEVARAARGIRELTSMLERNPESLLLGKGARK